MHYRVFRVTEPLEQKLLAVHEPQEGVPALVESLSEQGFHITGESALLLVKAILKRLRDKDGNSLLIKGFDFRTRDDGSRWLARYRFEYLGATLKMENADDWEITQEKIVSVMPFARPSSDVSDVVIPNILSEISQYSFCDCLGIRRVVIPEGVQEIGRMAFCGCRDLEEVVLPESVRSIGACAFAGCVNLRSIDLPEQLKTVAPLAFCGCEILERIALPDAVRELGYGAFVNCSTLTEVHGPSDLAIPVEKQVLYRCPCLKSVGLRLSRLQPNDHEALEEMQEAVELFAYLYLNDVNLQHFFAIQEIGEPDPSHIGSKIPNTDLERDIRHYFNHSNWVVLDDSVDIKATREREGTEFMQAIVVDTLRSLEVEVFSDTDEGLAYYEEEFNCIELISLRFLRYGGRWHVMTFEWSD